MRRHHHGAGPEPCGRGRVCGFRAQAATACGSGAAHAHRRAATRVRVEHNVREKNETLAAGLRRGELLANPLELLLAQRAVHRREPDGSENGPHPERDLDRARSSSIIVHQRPSSSISVHQRP